MKTYNQLQFVLPAGGVILVDANLMYVCAVQLGIKLVDDAMEYLHYQLGCLQSLMLKTLYEVEYIECLKVSISMFEEIRMTLARDYDNARHEYQA